MPELRLLHDHGDLTAVCELFADVWHLDPSSAPINAEVLRALVHNDSYLCGAFLDGVMVGGSVGFWGRDHDGWLLHSHITGVRHESTGGGIGFALKQHQRAWTLAHDVKRITWTFDPLIRRNAYFNLARLGAVAQEYHEAFYGEMRDPVNTGDESDRCVALWDLGAEPRDLLVAPRHDEVARTSRTTILSLDTNEWPVLNTDDTEAIVAAGERVLSAYVPKDIEVLRRTDPQKALAWRRALRSTFGAALRLGYVADSMSRDGWYTLRNNSSSGS